MSKAECKCCEEIEFWKNSRSNNELKIKDKIFAKISVYSWRNGKKCIKGKQFSTITSRAFNLNFCPSCRKEGG